MIEGRWRKVLYEDQPYPKNYFKQKKQKSKPTKEIRLQEISLFLQNISSVIIYFCIFYQIKTQFKKVKKISAILSLSAILLFSFFNFKIKENKKITKKLFSCFTILTFVFVNVPIFKTLVYEIDDDTIYLHFVWLTFLFVIDRTKCTIMNAPEKKVKIKVPLKIEFVDFLKESKWNVPMLGYNTIILAAFLLISRLDSSREAFLLICVTLFWFLCLEQKCARNKKEAFFVFLVFIFTFVLAFFTFKVLAFFYLGFLSFFYFVPFCFLF